MNTRLSGYGERWTVDGASPQSSVLPSETDLTTQYGVSRPTARTVFTALRNEGLTTMIHDEGSSVRRPDPLNTYTHRRAITRTPPNGAQRAIEPIAAQQWAYTDADLGEWAVVGEPERSRADASPTVAPALAVPERAPLFVCDRLLAGPTGRRVAHRLYLPLTVCAEVPALEADPFQAPGELYTLLGAHYGQLRWTEYVRTRMPTPREVSTLRTPDNAPLLVTRRITHAPSERPLALEETWLPSDGAQLTYTLSASTPDISDTEKERN